MVPVRKKDDEKQRCIKNAVIKLMLEEGFQGTSISKIAKEAGVSPATVYIYYENKDAMLREIYMEYMEDMFQSMLKSITFDMQGEEIITELICRYYYFINENKEIFHFTEQYSSCPILQNSCGKMKGAADLYQLLTELKNRQIINNYSNDLLLAILFAPVKAIVSKDYDLSNTSKKRLDELIFMIQKLLITR